VRVLLAMIIYVVDLFFLVGSASFLHGFGRDGSQVFFAFLFLYSFPYYLVPLLSLKKNGLQKGGRRRQEVEAGKLPE